jgi:cardiolipin synthase
MKFFKKKKYIEGNDVKLIKSGNSYFDTLEYIISQSKETIHFQTYIFEEDETGIQVATRLIEAAKRGVKVYLLIDAFGSNNLSGIFQENLKKQGVYIRKFSPIHFWKLETGRRLHHKIVVVDKKYALIGGINIANKYKGVKQLPWLDYAVLLEGKIVWQSYLLCYQIWNKRLYKPRIKKTNDVVYHPSNMKVYLSQHDFIRRKLNIALSYKNALKNAQKEVIIVSSYFLPSRRILKTILEAADRNVNVKIILGKQSDVPLSQKATYFLYRKLLEHNVEIYEYLPSIVHAKVMTVDEKWSTVGSYNLNFISEYNSIELNVDILDSNFAKILKNDLNLIIEKDCVKVNKQEYLASQTFFTHIRHQINYSFIRLLFKLLFLLTKKDKTYDII